MITNISNEIGVVGSDRKSQIELLKKDWFDMYARNGGGVVGSSGFEHSFMNEMKYGSPIGLHNWIYYYLQESKGNSIDYKGYMKNLMLGNVSSIEFYFQ